MFSELSFFKLFAITSNVLAKIRIVAKIIV